MIIPQDEKKLREFSTQLAEDCRVSQGQRAAVYRQYGQWQECGRAAGGLALANMLYSHLDRLAAHLFSPSELRFAIDYENLYPKEWLDKGGVAARLVSREWERKNIDMMFGHGVKEGLTYGACILKQLTGRGADGQPQFRGARLVMPWQFGVYNEAVNELSEQEAFCETSYLNKHEVWRRVRNLPDAEKLYQRILGSGTKDEGVGVPTSFMHQVLSTAVLNVNLQNATQPLPGGIVQLSNDPNFATLGPQVGIQLYPMQELWIRDDERGGGEDYTTIQFIEPDILIAGQLKHTNAFVPDTQPYTLIQSNVVPGYFWGRSEITDLQMLQQWLSDHLDDAKRLMAVQVDKILGFENVDGLTDEMYAQMTRVPGTIAVGQGAKIHDLTPSFPPELIPLIGQILMLMDRVSGFSAMMGGQGESGVRAGEHANLLMKMGGSRLRDRSLLAERQAASAADKTLAVLEAKDARAYWTDPAKGETDFLLSQLPDDRRISVDSHSSSPIYADDNVQLLAFGLKAGIVTGESFIEQAPYSHKDTLIARLKEKEANQLKLALEHPELFEQQAGGKKQRQAQVSHMAEGPAVPSAATH